MATTVCVGTYGDRSWADRARRAIESADPQAETIHVHGATLAEARNAAASQASGDRLIFLDADDRLAAGYVAAVETVAADLVQTAISYADAPPVMLTTPDMATRNYLHVGTAVNSSLFETVGGFHEWECYEDWELWLRCIAAGGTVGYAAGAVYHADGSGRNDLPRPIQLAAWRAIRRLQGAA